jgi:hypothetical protein
VGRFVNCPSAPDKVCTTPSICRNGRCAGAEVAALLAKPEPECRLQHRRPSRWTCFDSQLHKINWCDVCVDRHVLEAATNAYGHVEAEETCAQRDRTVAAITAAVRAMRETLR